LRKLEARDGWADGQSATLNVVPTEGHIIIIMNDVTEDVTEDTRETTYLFQRLSVALQRGNAVSFHSTFTTE